MATRAKATLKQRRRARVRKKVVGTATRPRMAVFRSSRHIAVQLIDDSAGTTLAAASTYEADLRDRGGTVTGAKAVGAAIAQRAASAGIDAVVFDRGGNRYTGRVAALADAAREAGLEL